MGIAVETHDNILRACMHDNADEKPLSSIAMVLAMSRTRILLFWIPFALVLALCVKNWWYFDSFGLSSWQPMSFYKMTTWNISQVERDSLYKAGVLTVFSTQEPFQRVWKYGIPITTPWQDRVKFLPRTPHRQVAVLDQSEFIENGSNLNHWTYLVFSRSQNADNKWAIKNHPEIFFRTWRMSAEIMTKSPTMWFRYVGHHGRRRVNLDSLAVYLPWIGGKEWSSQIDGGNIRYEK